MGPRTVKVPGGLHMGKWPVSSRSSPQTLITWRKNQRMRHHPGSQGCGIPGEGGYLAGTQTQKIKQGPCRGPLQKIKLVPWRRLALTDVAEKIQTSDTHNQIWVRHGNEKWKPRASWTALMRVAAPRPGVLGPYTAWGLAEGYCGPRNSRWGRNGLETRLER